MTVQRLEGSFTNSRNQRLHTLAYRPTEAPRALFLFHHGYGEHSGRYLPVFEWLAQAGVAVHTYDAHGHGRSEPSQEYDRHLIWDFQHMVDDWAAYSQQTRSQYAPDLPCFIGGHSMGSLTSILVVLQDQTPWAGLVCCSATVDVEWNWFLRLQASIGGVLAAIIPRAKIVPAVKGEDMQQDPQAVQEMEEDPLNSSGNVRARTANEFLKAFRRVFEHEHELQLPIYAHHGGCDRLANISAVRRMLRNAQSPDVTLKVIPGGFHEVMMGTERHDVTDHIIAWIHEKVQDAAHTGTLDFQEASPGVSASRRESTESCVSGSSSQPQLSMTSSLSSDESAALSSGIVDESAGEVTKQPLPQLRAGVGAAKAVPGMTSPAPAVAAPLAA